MDKNFNICPNCAGTLKNDIQHGMKICPFCESEFVLGEKETDVPVLLLEKKSYKIILQGTTDKVKTIKTCREVTGLGLKEVKDIVDNMPVVILENLEKEEAKKVVHIFETQDPYCDILMEVE